MDITAGIIYFQLQQTYHLETNIHPRRDLSVKGFRIWEGECPENDILYICFVRPPESEQWQRKMHIGINYENTAGSKSYFISVKGSVELYQLINSLQEIFQRFYNWRSDMDQLFYQHEDFATILNKLEETYDLISILVDKNLKYIAVSDGYNLCNPWVGDAETMSLDMVNDLMTDQNFRDAIRHNKAFLYYYNYDNITSYCYNIKIKGQYAARLLIQNKEGTPFYGGFRFAEYMGKHLKNAFTHYDDKENQGIVFYEFYNIIKDLLHGIPKSIEEIRQYLKIKGWEREHTYQVYLFQFSEAENAAVTKQYYKTEMEALFKNCCVLADEERLCCIRNLSMTNSDTWDVRQELSVFLRENLCKTGISQQFQDISQLRRYYLEAENALLLGINSQSTCWYYPFENMVLPFIWYQATKEIDAHQLFHPAIRTLIAYDKKEHSEMVKTVYEYMKHRYNATQTAHALFIHRTSMLFRLQRIEFLTGIDWDNWEDRIHIAATFELMKRIGEWERGD